MLHCAVLRKKTELFNILLRPLNYCKFGANELKAYPGSAIAKSKGTRGKNAWGLRESDLYGSQTYCISMSLLGGYALLLPTLNKV